jgi:TPR repeat protein
MAHRLYIYTDQETLVEAKYELPLFFYPLFIGNPAVKKNSIYATATEGVAFFEQLYNFIEAHADTLITDLNQWQEVRPKLSAEFARIAQSPSLMLEMSDVFNMSDTPHKVQAEEQLELIHRYNSIIQDAIEADNPALLDQLVEYRQTGYADFKSYLNSEYYSYGWQFCEAQWRKVESALPIEFEENGKFGLKNAAGDIIAPAKYDSLYAFAENTGLCVAEIEGQFCYLTQQGKVEFGQMFDDCYDFFDAHEPEKQIAIAKTNGQYGLINRQGEWVVPPAWDDMRGLFDRGELIAYKKGELWGVMDEAGNIIQAPQYPYKPLPNNEYSTSYYTCSPDDGEPVLYLSLNWKPFEFKKNTTFGAPDSSNHVRTALGEGKNARYGLMNKDAETVLECIYADLEYEYDLHVYRVKQDKKWGIFHPTNGWLLPCEYDGLNTILSILYSVAGKAHHSLLIARKGRQYGVYDSLKQTWLLPCTFGKITAYVKNVFGVTHLQPPEEAGIWVHNASTGQRLAGPYQSLSDIAGNLEFAAVIAFTHNQVFTVGQTGLVKPLTESQADSLEIRLPNDLLGEHYFTHAQATLIKNAFSPRKKADAIEAEAYALEQQGQYQRAYDLYVRAGQAGNSNGYVNAGYLVESQPELENPPLARHYYELAAQADNSMGINNLGNCYRHGIGGEQNMQKALQLFQESEAKNNLRAASNLADIYYHDEQLKDHAQALKYYLKAYREFPYPLEIGYLYDTLLKDYSSAHKYYEISAKQGQGYAYNRIGAMWQNGELGKINLTKAQSYYQKAISAEHPEAYAGLNLAKLIVTTNPTAAKAAWQFAMDHEDIVEGLLEFGQEQGWA